MRASDEGRAAGESRSPGGGLAGASGTPAEGSPKVAFVFPGLGVQWAGMGRKLYRSEAAVREVLDRCDAVFGEETGERLLPVITSCAWSSWSGTAFAQIPDRRRGPRLADGAPPGRPAAAARPQAANGAMPTRDKKRPFSDHHRAPQPYAVSCCVS
jgi:hypothetical protein